MVINFCVYSRIICLILCIGSLGEVKGKFKFFCGVVVDSEGRILVVDCYNYCV